MTKFATTIHLPFSDKYDKRHAFDYYVKHKDGLSRKLSHWRDNQLARKALKAAGYPRVVLDLPSGAGRFWPLLAEQPGRIILAADLSQDMLDMARKMQPKEIVNKISTFQSSAFNITLADDSVDCIFCMRLLHHVAEHEHRMAMLQEFHRVTKDTVIVSLWIDGNYKAWRRRRSESKRDDYHPNSNRFVLSQATAEAEFKLAGFDVVKHFDFLPKYAMWRVYVLRKG